MRQLEHPDINEVKADVTRALREDLGAGDITSELIPEKQTATARIITRENMILCGTFWANETLRLINSEGAIQWHFQDGQFVTAETPLCTLRGPARALLTAERTMLNFLQTLSATATKTSSYVSQLGDLPVKLLDTRKTLPGLRYAQKYAVRCGGGCNHRHGLYDAFLIKENHIKACGSIASAVAQAREIVSRKNGQKIEVEVTNLDEFKEALAAKPDVIMLDNFDLSYLKKAVAIRQDATIKLEASGGITLENIHQFGETGVDYISTGAITKNVNAIDLTMLLV